MMALCPQCRRYGNSRFCARDGQELVEATCPHCDRSVIFADDFCEHCGTRVREHIDLLLETADANF
jgi:predicted amidophosphoribosyltransferase